MNPNTSPSPPSDEEGQRLYRALLRPTATATWDFANAYLSHLTAWLQARNPRASSDLCDAAVVETVYGFLKTPEHFEPGRGTPLLTFLRLSAQRDLLNLLKREERHAHQPLDERVVELHSAGGKHQGERGPLSTLCDWEDEQERRAFLQEVRAILTGPEQQVFELMLSGERDTPVFVAALGLTHLAPEEQEAEVKRVKDRIKVRIKRWRRKP